MKEQITFEKFYNLKITESMKQFDHHITRCAVPRECRDATSSVYLQTYRIRIGLEIDKDINNPYSEPTPKQCLKALNRTERCKKYGNSHQLCFFSLFHRTLASYYQSIAKHDKNQLSKTFRVARPIAANLFLSMAVARKIWLPQTSLSTILSLSLK